MEILYFSAPWCGPCQTFRPRLFEVIKDYPNLTVKQINIDDELALGLKHNIFSIPTLVAGKYRLEGAANEEFLRLWLDNIVV